MFLPIGYPKHFCGVLIKKFEAVNERKPSNENAENTYVIFFIDKMYQPYFGKPSHKFDCNITKLI